MYKEPWWHVKSWQADFSSITYGVVVSKNILDTCRITPTLVPVSNQHNMELSVYQKRKLKGYAYIMPSQTIIHRIETVQCSPMLKISRWRFLRCLQANLRLSVCPTQILDLMLKQLVFYQNTHCCLNVHPAADCANAISALNI